MDERARQRRRPHRDAGTRTRRPRSRPGVRLAGSRRRGVADRRHRGREPEQLHDRQILVEQEPAERCPGERGGEAEQGWGLGREPLDPTEPEDERHARGDHAQVGEADQVRRRQRRRRSLDDEDGGKQHCGRDEHLHPRGGQPVGEARHLLRGDDAGRERHVRSEGRHHADEIDGRTGSHDHHGDADGRRHADHDLAAPHHLAGHHPGDEPDEQRLDAADRRRDTAGQPVHGDDQQGEEQPEVACREQDQLSPLRPTGPRRGAPTSDGHQDEAGREQP